MFGRLWRFIFRTKPTNQNPFVGQCYLPPSSQDNDPLALPPTDDAWPKVKNTWGYDRNTHTYMAHKIAKENGKMDAN